MTSATLPSLNISKVVSNIECEAQILWHKNPLSSEITLSVAQDWLEGDFVGDEIRDDVQLFDYLGDSIIRNIRSMTYRCNSSDFCNNQTILKLLLDSLVVEERFPEEFYSLVNNTSTFNNNTAATCLRFANVTSTCTMPNFGLCQGCICFRLTYTHTLTVIF